MREALAISCGDQGLSLNLLSCSRRGPRVIQSYQGPHREKFNGGEALDLVLLGQSLVDSGIDSSQLDPFRQQSRGGGLPFGR